MLSPDIINWHKEDVKNEFHKARKEMNGDIGGFYTFDMIKILQFMAERNIIPDGNFSDTDCMIWEAFRYCLTKEES